MINIEFIVFTTSQSIKKDYSSLLKNMEVSLMPKYNFAVVFSR
jgi:hypothetical protein